MNGKVMRIIYPQSREIEDSTKLNFVLQGTLCTAVSKLELIIN